MLGLRVRELPDMVAESGDSTKTSPRSLAAEDIQGDVVWMLNPTKRLASSTGLAWLGVLSLASCSTPPAQPIEILAELQARPGNPAITFDGRLLFTQHPIDQPEFKVVELREDGEIRPFPTKNWSRDRMGAVLGIEARSNGLVWMLDMGGNGLSPKIIAWDTKRESLAHQIQIPETVRVESSFLQDLAVVEKHGIVVLADMTLPGPFDAPEPALIVVDIDMGTARRVLQSDPSFMPTVDRIVVEGSPLQTKTKGGDLRDLRMALNPITVDPAQEWIYYGAMSGTQIYRIPTKVLANPELGDEAIRASIEPYAKKAPSDGFRVDGQGQVFVTDLEGNGIGVATPDGYRLEFTDPSIAWADGLAFDRDGAVVVTVNQLHLHEKHHGGVGAGQPPYLILRLNEVRAKR
ncbi:MAG: sugar lactone lactonase YvrE [Planctomycetota bacterium]|jgi:sugar lactone lactonase YvrE